MSRRELITCDCCGTEYDSREWTYLPGHRFLVFPGAWRKLGGSWFEVCSKKCEIIFRTYARHYLGEDIFEYTEEEISEMRSLRHGVLDEKRGRW